MFISKRALNGQLDSLVKRKLDKLWKGVKFKIVGDNVIFIGPHGVVFTKAPFKISEVENLLGLSPGEFKKEFPEQNKIYNNDQVKDTVFKEQYYRVIGNALKERSQPTSPTSGPAPPPTSAKVAPEVEKKTPAFVGVFDEAKKLKEKGVKYRWGAESFEEGGFDCSGFIYYIFNKAGIPMKRTNSRTMRKTIGAPISSKQALKPGDLLFWEIPKGKRFVSHVGMYIGNHKFIHSSISKGVNIANLKSKLYADNLVAIRRVPEISQGFGRA